MKVKILYSQTEYRETVIEADSLAHARELFDGFEDFTVYTDDFVEAFGSDIVEVSEFEEALP